MFSVTPLKINDGDNDDGNDGYNDNNDYLVDGTLQYILFCSTIDIVSNTCHTAVNRVMDEEYQQDEKS